MTRPPVDVRQAGTGDADDLIELWVQARAEIAGAGRAVLGGGPDVIRARLLDALSRHDDLHVLLARWEGRPAGFAVVRVGHLMPLADDDCVQLEHLFVTPSLRRHGVARALLGGVAGLAERHGADQILGGAPPSAREVHRFLARLGFTPLVLRRVTATATLRRRLAGESRRSALEDLLSRRRSSRAKSVRAATPPHGIALVPACEPPPATASPLTTDAGSEAAALAAQALAAENRAVQDLAFQDLAVQDLAVEDLAAEDLAVQDLAVEDLAVDDLAVEDLAVADLAIADLAVEDLAVTVALDFDVPAAGS